MENNDANRPSIPGFGDTALDYELPLGSRFAHGFSEWEQVPAITKRELTMVAVMNDLTDKPNWSTDILRPDVVDSWRDELRASTPLMSDKAWEWCVAELRDKALRLAEDGYLSVLDTGSRVCKSDTLVSQTLCGEIRAAFRSVLAVLGPERKIRGGVVSSVIDPSSHHLVWGKSLVTTGGGGDGDQVSLQQAPVHQDKRIEFQTVHERMQAVTSGSIPVHPDLWAYVFQDNRNLRAYLWSYKYQWLPCEVAFVDSDAKQEPQVHITSYINGLSRASNIEVPSLDGMLGKLISLSIKPWNDCLIEGRQEWLQKVAQLPLGGSGWEPPAKSYWPQRGRVPCRIITYGVEWENTAPEWVELFNTHRRKWLQRYQAKKAEIEKMPSGNADRQRAEVALKQKYWEVSGMVQLPEPTDAQRAMAREFVLRPIPGCRDDFLGWLAEGWEGNDGELGRAVRLKVSHSVRHKHPEPGTAFSYHEWKSGTHGGRAIVDMVTDRPINPTKPPPSTPHKPYTIRLQDQFRTQGLQVIIRAQEITLEPGETQEYTGSGDWTVAGMKNEHIVAVSMLAYDVENVTDVRISYRQQTNVAECFWFCGGNLYQDTFTGNPFIQPMHREGITMGGEAEALADVFGFDPLQVIGCAPEYAMSVQEIGSVALRQGRLVAFPNTMEHRLEGFRLQDTGKGGHFRWVTLMLVDPHYRICSTRNVPQQQFSREETGEYRREMDKEQALANYTRWTLTHTFFLD